MVVVLVVAKAVAEALAARRDRLRELDARVREVPEPRERVGGGGVFGSDVARIRLGARREVSRGLVRVHRSRQGVHDAVLVVVFSRDRPDVAARRERVRRRGGRRERRVRPRVRVVPRLRDLALAPAREVGEDRRGVFVHARGGGARVPLRAREVGRERAVTRGGHRRGGGGAERLAEREPGVGSRGRRQMRDGERGPQLLRDGREGRRRGRRAPRAVLAELPLRRVLAPDGVLHGGVRGGGSRRLPVPVGAG